MYGFAHRGGAHGPDNTIGTFAAALARGARGLETDAWLTRDGVVVLDHDGRGGPPGKDPIIELTSRQLPDHIPTLDRLYEACGSDYDLAVDVKSPEVAVAVSEVAQRHHAVERLWVVAPHPEQMADLGGAHRVVTLRGSVIRTPRRISALIRARNAGVEAVNARWMWWSRRRVEEVHVHGLLAFGYDAQRRSSLERSVAIGLDGVFSDHVDLMIDALAAPSGSDD
jgi:glycerophosphoryl diester phosphodiesterase